MNESRFTVGTADSLEIGEVVYLFVDRTGYHVQDPRHYSMTELTMRGATVFARGKARGGNNMMHFVGWTNDDNDILASAADVDHTDIRSYYSNVETIKNFERFTKCFYLDKYDFVMRQPAVMRANTVNSRTPGDICCSKCKEPHSHAAPNMSDGTFRCYECRVNPYR